MRTQVDNSYTSAQAIVDRITSTADTIAGTGSQWLYGRINAVRAAGSGKPTNARVTAVTATSISYAWDDHSLGETNIGGRSPANRAGRSRRPCSPRIRRRGR